MQDVVKTKRLALRAIQPEAIRFEQKQDYPALSHWLGAGIPPAWPPKDWEPHVLQFLLDQVKRSPEQAGWNRYIVLLPEFDRTEPMEGWAASLIGFCGAFAVSESEAEFGYCVLPAYEGRGLATEAAHGLLGHLRVATALQFVRAHTFPHLRASVRVLEKCGLEATGEGEEPGSVCYRMRLRR